MLNTIQGLKSRHLVYEIGALPLSYRGSGASALSYDVMIIVIIRTRARRTCTLAGTLTRMMEGYSDIYMKRGGHRQTQGDI